MVRERTKPQEETSMGMDTMVTAIEGLPAPKKMAEDSLCDKKFNKVVVSQISYSR